MTQRKPACKEHRRRRRKHELGLGRFRSVLCCQKWSPTMFVSVFLLGYSLCMFLVQVTWKKDSPSIVAGETSLLQPKTGGAWNSKEHAKTPQTRASIQRPNRAETFARKRRLFQTFVSGFQRYRPRTPTIIAAPTCSRGKLGSSTG